MMLLDGKKIKLSILDELKDIVSKLDDKPHLVVIQVGDNLASNIYVNQKQKMTEYVGYKYTHMHFDENISQDELIQAINKLNDNECVHGVLVQLPLPSHIDAKVILNMVSWMKDVDGLTDINASKLLHNEDTLYPCTPYGIMELLRKYDISVIGKKVVIVGRSDLVGKPLAIMMMNAGATVTLCHSKTANLEKYTSLADILVVAIGRANFITADMVKDGAVVIDVGINCTGKLSGDVCYDEVKSKASYITPVPGGVGQMTVAIVGKNLLKAYEMQSKDKR